jgi:DNA-binding MarR family transcriptional regulator/GNAT superfamily N-acetyltransferase
MQIDAVRRFNRFYTRHVGALGAGLLGSPYPLPEARLIYELGRRRECTPTALGAELELDPGYLSRLLQSLKRRGLARARPSPDDGRASLVSLTDQGRRAFADLDTRSRRAVGKMLGALPRPDQARLVGAMRTVQTLLCERKAAEVALRGPRAGDLGWVVQAHGEIYEREYGWGQRFEALVAKIVAEYAAADPGRSRCWIAEIDGERVGCVFVVPGARRLAKLRLLVLDKRARGRGLGRRLVQECIDFARGKGYAKLVLWTQSDLGAARALYRDCGFELKKREPHASFGVALTGEYWELDLKPGG